MLFTNREVLSPALSRGYAFDTFNPQKILGPPKENMKKVVKEKMGFFGSSQKVV